MSEHIDVVPPKDGDPEPSGETSYALPITVALCLLLIVFSDVWALAKRRRRTAT